MSLHRLPSGLRRRLLPSPSIHQRRHASILFALSALSNSRETQHFNKATKLSRVEHSPALKLIQTSEVDPFASTEKGRRDVSGAAGSTGDGGGKSGDAVKAGGPGKEESTEGVRSIGTGIAGGVNAPVASTGPAAFVAASGSESGGSGRRPPNDEHADVQSDALEEHSIDDGLALQIGRGFLNKHVQRAQMLQRAQKTNRRRIRELEEKVAEQQREEKRTIRALKDERSALPKFTFVLGVGGGLFLWYVLGDARPGAEKTKKLQAQLDETRKTAEQVQAKHSSARAKLEKELFDSRMTHGQALATLETREREAHVKDQNYEARRAEWTRQAEELKAAVERKDVGTLTRAEREAYAEALVWLRVKDVPERRWWRGLFWCQE